MHSLYNGLVVAQYPLGVASTDVGSQLPVFDKGGFGVAVSLLTGVGYPRWLCQGGCASVFRAGQPAMLAVTGEDPRYFLRVSYYTRGLAVHVLGLLGRTPPRWRRFAAEQLTHALLYTSTTSLAACAVGLTRGSRASAVALTCLSRALRRYLLVSLYQQRLITQLRGLLPGFSSFWGQLNQPANELFVHPLSRELVLDMRLPSSLRTSSQVRG
jgi:hypothetical protein